MLFSHHRADCSGQNAPTIVMMDRRPDRPSPVRGMSVRVRAPVMPAKKEKLVWCLDNLEEQPIDWLWPGRLPAAKLTLIDGDPSQGKSLLTLDLASRLTTARPFPDGFAPPQPSSVVLVGSEDGIRDTVLPRLRAAGADLRRVHVFAGRACAGAWSGLPTFP